MSESTQPKKLRVEYLKSSAFRIIHADGALGGTSPRLELFITFYSERFPIPKVLTYEPTSTNSPGREIMEERESKEGIIREVEVGVMLDLPAAKKLPNLRRRESRFSALKCQPRKYNNERTFNGKATVHKKHMDR